MEILGDCRAIKSKRNKKKKNKRSTDEFHKGEV